MSKRFTNTFNSLDAFRRFALKDQNQLKPIVTNHACERLLELDSTRPVRNLAKTLLALWRASTFYAEQRVGHMRLATLRMASGSRMEVILCAKPDHEDGTAAPVLTTIMTTDMARNQLAFLYSSHRSADQS